MNLREALLTVLPAERVLTRDIDCIAHASDASFYRLVPRAVVRPQSIPEIQRLFEFSRTYRIPIVFRAAGTSLSGQAVTGGILVHLARHWKTLEVLDSGRRVRVGPGVIGAHVNHALRPYGAKLGPDPASINACMIGGILANNSSGMCCGVQQNSYHTIHSLVFVLPDGTAVDTAAPDADAVFVGRAPAIVQGLLRLRDRVRTTPHLREKIRAKYRMKNTTGYSLNAFLDFDRPVEIMRNLLIGSEGTLGFIAEAVYTTVPDLPLKYTGLLFFASLADACAAIGPLTASGAAALELFDYASLRAVEHQPGAPAHIAGLPPTAAALLVEYQTADAADQQRMQDAADRLCPTLPLLYAPVFTADAREQAVLWTIRKGLLPSVGAVRASGTSVIIEDIVFPVERLADAVGELQYLFARHGYERAIVFGHAKDGNIHFVITQSFNDALSVGRYERFMDDLVALVVRYDGALKAEHGTGRNMAPFVETEWGSDAYAVMKELKELIDPQNLLNPGVIITADPRAHLADLKTLPPVESEVDMCTECGYCERVCPSRDLTTTPRQRIVLRREQARLAAGGQVNPHLNGAIDYAVLHTCAADGLCSLACPVGINTGALVKRLRTDKRPPREQQRIRTLARSFATVELLAKAGVHLGHAASRLLGAGGVNGMVRVAEWLFGVRLPKWNTAMPRARREGVPTRRDARAEFVYFPTCTGRVLGSAPQPDTQPLIETMMLLCLRAGVQLAVSEEPRGLCCGMPFFSKGFNEAGEEIRTRTFEALQILSDGGRLPIVVDAGSCALDLRTAWQGRLTILDSVEFLHDVLLPRLPVHHRVPSVVLHPTCSMQHMQTEQKGIALARACAERVVVPASAGCCGMAGDRGLLFPELTAAATQPEAAELAGAEYTMYVSNNLPCEMALSAATGRRWVSVLYLLERATRNIAQPS